MPSVNCNEIIAYSIKSLLYCCRELKRIVSISLSPIYEHFAETLSGLSTIRALRDVARFTEDNEMKLDASQRATFSGTFKYF